LYVFANVDFINIIFLQHSLAYI